LLKLGLRNNLRAIGNTLAVVASTTTMTSCWHLNMWRVECIALHYAISTFRAFCAAASTRWPEAKLPVSHVCDAASQRNAMQRDALECAMDLKPRTHAVLNIHASAFGGVALDFRRLYRA